MYIHILEYFSLGMVRAVTRASIGAGVCIFTLLTEISQWLLWLA